MCHGVKITFRCCGKRQNRIIAGGQCENSAPCGRIWGRALVRRQCILCRRQRAEGARRANENHIYEASRAKALLEYFQGSRPTPLTDGEMAEREHQRDVEYWDLHWDQWKAGTRLHPFPSGTVYTDIVRMRFSQEARIGLSAFNIIRPQLWEECVRRQEEIDISPRILSSVDKGFDFAVVLTGRRTTGTDAILRNEEHEVDSSTEHQSEGSIEPFPNDRSNRVSPSPLLTPPIDTIAEPSVSESVETTFRSQRSYSANTVYTGPANSDEHPLIDPDEDSKGRNPEEYSPNTDWTHSERAYITDFYNWCDDANFRRYETGTQIPERCALPLDVQDYLDHLGHREDTARVIVNLRSIMEGLKSRPFRFYPSSTPGRRQLLPLSAWLTVQLYDEEPSTYTKTIEEYRRYVRQCGTQEQFNEYLDCLDEHAAINRGILLGQIGAVDNMFLWTWDRVQPQDRINLDFPFELPGPLYEFLDDVDAEDPRISLPTPLREPPSFRDSQTQEMIREFFRKRPELNTAPTVSTTQLDDGRDEDSEVLETSESSEDPSSNSPVDSSCSQFVWTGSDDGDAEEGEILETEQVWERTRAMFRKREEEDARVVTLGPWTLEEAKDGVMVSLSLDSDDEDKDDEASWVRRDWFGTGRRGGDRGRARLVRDNDREP